jgi:hypothetical protein
MDERENITIQPGNAVVSHLFGAGASRRQFPALLAPEQVRMLTLNDEERLVTYVCIAGPAGTKNKEEVLKEIGGN